jgi:OOP family OmpA-OmpF porin
MKKLILFSFILAFSVTLNAQTSDKKWGVGGGFGAYGTLNNFNAGVMPEFYLSSYLSPSFDVMLKADLGIWRSGLKSTVDMANPFLNLRYKLTDDSQKLRPYLFVGPGFLADNSKSGINFDLGVGTKYYSSSNMAFYADAGYINGIKVNNVRDNFWKLTMGMEFDFGKVKDADMDGVSDKKDKCPDTPAGVAVDVNGCPIDSDGDGVADYIDDCPTVAGLTSLKGCPDKDKDGIADKDDACPDVAGLASLKGCPDSDGDGVADKDDKCPDTPKGVAVDSKGCPKDTDGDGVADYQDDCPTVKGPKDNKGCPVVVKEIVKKEITLEQIEIQKIKVSPVHFLSGKSYLTDFSKGILDKLVKILNTNKDYNVNIFGYTDSQGSEEFNLKLSEDRINSTIKYLVSKGISDMRIINQKAFGKAKPIASNKTPEGRLQNRRVEFEIFKMK